MLMHPSSPYQVRTKSVSSPSKGTFIRTRYGLGTDLGLKNEAEESALQDEFL